MEAGGGAQGNPCLPRPLQRPISPTQAERAGTGWHTEGGALHRPGLAPTGGLDQSEARKRGPAPSPGHPGARRSPASWLLRRPGAKNKLQRTSLWRRSGLL